MKKKILIVANIPSPYRVDFFSYLQENITEFEWYIIFTNKIQSGNNWAFDISKLKNTIVLNAKIITVKGKIYNRQIHLFTNIKKYFKKIDPDVIIAFEYNPAAIQSLIWAKINRKMFINLTDGTLHSEKNIGIFQKISRKLIINFADSYIASSSKAKEKLLHWNAPRDRIFISYLTEDLTDFINCEVNPIKNKILYVGSILYGKGIDLLFNALAKVKKDFQLSIVGDGADKVKNDLMLQAMSLGLSKRIKWCGYKSGNELIQEYKTSDVFVFPTREDCFGLVLLEAVSIGLTTITSKYADAVYDIIGKESIENNYIIDPYNSDEFANAISKCLNKDCVNYNKVDISKFKFENVAKGFKKAIDMVLL